MATTSEQEQGKVGQEQGKVGQEQGEVGQKMGKVGQKWALVADIRCLGGAILEHLAACPE